MNLFKKISTRNGARIESKKWYVSIDKKHIPLHTDKKLAREMAAQLLGKKAAGVLGVIVHKGGGESAPLPPLVNEWRAALVSKGSSAAHAEQTSKRASRVLTGCGFDRLRDIDGDKARRFIDALTINKGKDRDRPAGAQTKQFHLKAVRQFGHWLVKRKRIGSNPFAGVDGWDVKADRRHDRRELSDDELAALLTGTEGAPVERWGLSAPDRVMLYRVALSTGLRASELAALKPENVDLTAEVITLAGKYTKNGLDAVQPISPDLHSTLSPWLKKRPKGEPLWPGAWAKWFAAGKMLRQDLEAAGVAYQTDAGFADFHALRHTYISRLIRSGVNLKVAQTLARHGNVSMTADRYGHLAHGEKRAAVSGFSIPGCKPDANGEDDDDQTPVFPVVPSSRNVSTEPKVAGSTPAGCTQGNTQESLGNAALPPHVEQGTEGNEKHLNGTAPMQIGCKQPTTPDPNGIPKVLFSAWPNVPKHIRLAILALIEPYRDDE